jgi:hypothetical protein
MTADHTLATLRSDFHPEVAGRIGLIPVLQQAKLSLIDTAPFVRLQVDHWFAMSTPARFHKRKGLIRCEASATLPNDQIRLELALCLEHRRCD